MKYPLAVLLTCISSLAVAQNQELKPSLTIGLDATSYDNVFNQQVHKDTDTSIGVNASTAINKIDQYYSISMSYAAKHLSYLQDSFEDQRSVVGSGNIVLGKHSSPLKWTVSSSEQETLRSTVSTNTPDNISQRSTVSTGPQLFLRLGKVDSLNLTYQYQSVTIEESAADTTSDLANIAWTHRYNKFGAFGLAANYSDIAPKIDPDNNFTQTGANFFFNHQFKNGQIDVSFGQSTIDGFFGLDEIEDETYSIDFKYNIGDDILSLNAKKSLSNSSLGENSFYSFEDFGANELDIQIRNQFGITYSIPRFVFNTQLNLNASQLKSTSQSSTSEEINNMAVLNLSKRLKNQFSLSINIDYSDRSVSGESYFSSQFLTRAGISLRKKIGQRANARCSINRMQSRGGVVFEANTVRCNFGYNLL